MPKRVTVKIDRKHSLQLLHGDSITIKVPKDATELTLQLMTPERESSMAEIMDVFFNGRPARA